MTPDKPSPPDKDKIARFLKCFNILGEFEAKTQLVRRYGAFDSKEWPDKPDPVVREVADWLKSLADDSSAAEVVKRARAYANSSPQNSREGFRSFINEMANLIEQLLLTAAEQAQALRATEWAIRELFELPKDGDLFEHIANWDQDRAVGEVRLQNAVHNVLAEMLYEGRRKENGIAVLFLMRLSMLACEAGLEGWDKENPVVAEAIRVLGDPGQPNIRKDDASASELVRQSAACAGGTRCD